MDRQETEEIKRHFGVVADSLRSEIRLVAEGLEDVRRALSGDKPLRPVGPETGVRERTRAER